MYVLASTIDVRVPVYVQLQLYSCSCCGHREVTAGLRALRCRDCTSLYQVYEFGPKVHRDLTGI